MNRIKELREFHNITAKQLASKVDVSPGAISRYENGCRIPDGDTLKRIANFFNVSIDYILGNDYQPSVSFDAINSIVVNNPSSRKEILDFNHLYLKHLKIALNNPNYSKHLRIILEELLELTQNT